MRRALALVGAAVAVAASSSAHAASSSQIGFSRSTTAGVATLELVDPIDRSGRSIPTLNGVHYSLCDSGPLRPCNLGRGALAARRQAVELARAAFRDTDVDLVVVGLPQSPTRHVQLVFERDILTEGLEPLAATAARLYAMCCLVPHSPTEDSLVLVRLRPSPAVPSGR